MLDDTNFRSRKKRFSPPAGAGGGFAAQEDAAAISSRSVFAVNPKCRADQSATGVSK